MGYRNLLAFCLLNFLATQDVAGVQILSKSKLEKCEQNSGSYSLNCTKKIVLNMAVPSGSSGGEASIKAEIVEVEENSTNKLQTLRTPPVLTVSKSAAYVLYELTYIRDVPYKPEEFYVRTRKCEPDASARVVHICERLRDESGHIIQSTQPICCPCGAKRRMPTSCGNFFDKMIKGKANTAHCLRFPGDWFHVFSIGQWSLGFSVQIHVKSGSKVSEVSVGPENKTVVSNDNFLRVNLIGDLVGYTNIPSFEDFYLVIPRQGGPGQPQNLGSNFSLWMLLERVRFTLDGLECNKIGVGYETFNSQPDFCTSPFWSCLHNQLWNFREADLSRIDRNQLPLYGVEGRFERINQHPNAGTHSFSIGVTEVLNTNLVIELRADDVEYVYQRSPGKIMSINIPTFEALTQFGVATIATKNTGEVEASYSLTFLFTSNILYKVGGLINFLYDMNEHCRAGPQGARNVLLELSISMIPTGGDVFLQFTCSKEVSLMEEQYFIMKPKEVASHSFKLYPTTDQAAKYVCVAILKDADFSEVDRAECQFATTATVLDNGSQITPFQLSKRKENGFIDSIKLAWKKLWGSVVDFVTGKSCRKECSGFFDFSCHIQYICLSWLVLFALFLATFPAVLVLVWILHQKGLFDPLYDWWEDMFPAKNQPTRPTWKHKGERKHSHRHGSRHHHNHHGSEYKMRSHELHKKHKHSDRDIDYFLHHVHRKKDKRGRNRV